MLTFSQSVDSTPKGKSTIVHYHTRGEFQPVPPPLITVSEVPESHDGGYQAVPEEPYGATGNESEPLSTTAQTDSEIIHTTTESPLHENAEYAREAEEAYVSPAQEPAHKEPEREITYTTWDASRSASSNPMLTGSITDYLQGPTTVRLPPRSLQFPFYPLRDVIGYQAMASPGKIPRCSKGHVVRCTKDSYVPKACSNLSVGKKCPKTH